MASSEEYKKTVFIYKYIHLNSKQVIAGCSSIIPKHSLPVQDSPW